MNIKVWSNDQIERIGNRLWILTKPFKFSVDNVVYTIPRGFVTDGASCPRLLWSICSPVAGPFGQAAIVHDWFYNEGPDVGQYRADKILYTMSRLRGAGVSRALIVKFAVNLFGRFSYKTKKTKICMKSCYNIHTAMQRVKEVKNGYMV